jgi:hypothetical protein
MAGSHSTHMTGQADDITGANANTGFATAAAARRGATILTCSCAPSPSVRP